MIFKVIVIIFAAVTLTHGVSFECRLGNGEWFNVGTKYTCDDSIINYDRNLSHVINVTGTHSRGNTNADVKAFYIASSHQLFNRIPKGIEEFFPNLIAIAWVSGNLTSLTADDFKPFPDLQEIWFYNNKLVSLDGDLFKNTPKLGYVQFGNNLLEHVGSGFLDGLDILSDAYFHNNHCIDALATNSAKMQELKLKLQNQCPPSI